jgi:hypothetical protein
MSEVKKIEIPLLEHIEVAITGMRRLAPMRLGSLDIEEDVSMRPDNIHHMREVSARVTIRSSKFVAEDDIAKTREGVLSASRKHMADSMIHHIFGPVRDEVVSLAILAEGEGLRDTDLCKRLWALVDALTPGRAR